MSDPFMTEHVRICIDLDLTLDARKSTEQQTAEVLEAIRLALRDITYGDPDTGLIGVTHKFTQTEYEIYSKPLLEGD